VPDAQIYTVEHAGLILFSIPFAGRVVAAASGPLGLFFLGGYAAFAGTILIDQHRKKNRSGGARKAEGSRKAADDRTFEPDDALHLQVRKRRRLIGGARDSTSARVIATALLLGGAATMKAAPETTFAAWTDGVDVGTSTLSTYTVPVPGNFRCGGLGVASVQFQWNAVAGATNYTLHYGSGGGTTMTVAGTSQTITTLISGGTAWVNANQNFGSTTWTSANSNTRSYTVAVVSLCS